MSGDRWQQILREVTGVPGVRGALILSADDGLVVAESAMDALDTADVAALAAMLVSRAGRCAAAMATAAPTAVHLTARHGALVAVAGPEPLWLAAVADHDAELGRLRLLLGDFAGAIG
jgi:predicted regulator of Ras-like GTPase activity (Roadblock/LC7/MglB family)